MGRRIVVRRWPAALSPGRESGRAGAGEGTQEAGSGWIRRSASAKALASIT